MMRVGILGGGQLARMLAEAGLPLGLEFLFLDPKPGACAGVLGEQRVAEWDDPGALEALAGCDRVTCDFENVPAGVLEQLARQTVVRPSASALAAAQDRLSEKNLFRRLEIPVGPFAEVSGRPQLLSALDRIGYPAVLKTRRLGYDGKGQYVLGTPEDLEPAWQALGGRELIVEGWVDYRHECSITAVRSAEGEIRCYPLSWTVHDHGILRLALAPAPVAGALAARARELVGRLAGALEYVGALTLELFVTGEGELLANEFAPRVHNSAHWTIEGAECSQFENHMRALCDLPLGATGARGASLMINWIGELPGTSSLLAVDGVHWHDYGKQPRAGRKLGHATVNGADRAELDRRMAEVAARLDAHTASLLSALPNGANA